MLEALEKLRLFKNLTSISEKKFFYCQLTEYARGLTVARSVIILSMYFYKLFFYEDQKPFHLGSP